jgi:hypothetical protein
MTETRHVRDLSAEESAALLRELKRGPPPPADLDTPPPKMAKNMTEDERRNWLAAHRKRFPS